MAFKIKDGVRIGTVDVFNNSGTLLVAAPSVTNSLTAGTGLTWLASSIVVNVAMHDQLLDKQQPNQIIQEGKVYATTGARDSRL